MKNSDSCLSIVIPCFNEEENIRKGVLGEIEKFLNSKSYEYEVLIIDDGSSDKSKKLICDFIKTRSRFSLIENPHRGKAYSVITGLLRSKNDNILFTDFDQATPIGELDKMLSFTDQYDIIVGSRKSNRQGAPLFRIIMARGFMWLRGIILNLGELSDTQCGFKLFTKKTVKPLIERLRIYSQKKIAERNVKGSHVSAGFDVEILFLAKKLGFKIKEVPVVWNYVDTRRVSPIFDSIEGFLDLLRIRFNDWLGYYK